MKSVSPRGSGWVVSELSIQDQMQTETHPLPRGGTGPHSPKFTLIPPPKDTVLEYVTVLSACEHQKTLPQCLIPTPVQTARAIVTLNS